MSVIKHIPRDLKNGPIQESTLIRQREILYKHSVTEPVPAWLVQLWHMGVDGISLAAVEAGKPSNIT